MNIKDLKSGTDIRGIAIGECANLTIDAAKRLAAAFTVFVLNKKDNNKSLRISIGHDSRLSADNISEAAIEGLMLNSDEVYFCGLSSTPAMFMTTVLNGCDGAIMLTASHHPKNRNGFKFFTKDGGISKADLDQIVEIAEKLVFARDFIVSKSCMVVKKDFLEDYCAFMRDYFIGELRHNEPLKGYKIAVDAGNGAAGFYATRILGPLGADISSSQFLKPDGNFPNHVPNPEDKDAIESISKRVVDTKSDLGIIFDTDGDRSAIVLKNGKEINRNRLIALAAAIIIEENKEKQAPIIVTDSITSEGLKDFISKLGGIHIRYKRGYQNVIGYAKKLHSEGNNAPLAIETSGHAALKENFYLDDGAYLAAKLLIKAIKLKREGKDLDYLIKDLKEPKEEKIFRLDLVGQDWKKTGDNVLKALEKLGHKYKVAEDSFEGIRIYLEGGFLQARMSVHDPVLAINIESDNEGGAEKIEKILFQVLHGIEGLII
ncbi:MAG: phosphomannomutase/phosphoglucomutase [Firmicutes bacterium]|nr:phosphomannomutase/phosphoglucomutase [Bacillota bacterium]